MAISLRLGSADLEKVLKHSPGQQRESGDDNHRANQDRSAGRLIRIFGQESREKAVFDTASDAVRRASFVLLVRQGALPPLTEILQAMLFLAVAIGAWFAQVSFPLIIAFVILLYRLQPHTRALQGSWSQLQGLSGSVEEVAWMLDPSGKPEPPQGHGPFHGLRKASNSMM